MPWRICGSRNSSPVTAAHSRKAAFTFILLTRWNRRIKCRMKQTCLPVSSPKNIAAHNESKNIPACWSAWAIHLTTASKPRSARVRNICAKAAGFATAIRECLHRIIPATTPGQFSKISSNRLPTAGAGVHVKNLYNDYVYFWRWALWKLFENPEASGPGIITFITAASYLRGPGFVGMRRKMREAFDELWIIDLEGDNLGARKTENVFAIQTPVAIAIGVRYGNQQPQNPARVRYTKITGTREEKYSKLDTIRSFADLEWQDCFDGWYDPFLPRRSWQLLCLAVIDGFVSVATFRFTVQTHLANRRNGGCSRSTLA